MAEELGDRTEKATSKKLSNARQRGQIAKSPEFAAALDLIGALILLVMLGPGLFSAMTALVRALLMPDSLSTFSPGSVPDLLAFSFTKAAIAIAPFVGIMFIVAAVAQFTQVGLLWTFKPLMPKFSRLNPIAGVARLFSRRSAVKSGVSIVKLCIVLPVVGSVIASKLQAISFLPALSLTAAMVMTGRIIFELALWLLVLLLVLGLADFVYQRWQHAKDLMMTRQEVKQERRNSEGDEVTKGRRLRMARNMLLQQMQQSVKTADVIVTNPTHFAVALKYDSNSMHAPKVVAKGADYMAFRIREMATAAGVPIVEKPPLARALYAGVDVGRYVSPELYQAVAEILAYVYRLKNKAA